MTFQIVKALFALAAFFYWVWPMLGGQRPSLRRIVEAIFAALAVFAASSVGLAGLALLRSFAPHGGFAGFLALALAGLAYIALAGLWVVRLGPSSASLPAWAAHRWGLLDIGLALALAAGIAATLAAS